MHRVGSCRGRGAARRGAVGERAIAARGAGAGQRVGDPRGTDGATETAIDGGRAREERLERRARPGGVRVRAAARRERCLEQRDARRPVVEVRAHELDREAARIGAKAQPEPGRAPGGQRDGGPGDLLAEPPRLGDEVLRGQVDLARRWRGDGRDSHGGDHDLVGAPGLKRGANRGYLELAARIVEGSEPLPCGLERRALEHPGQPPAPFQQEIDAIGEHVEDRHVEARQRSELGLDRGREPLEGLGEEGAMQPLERQARVRPRAERARGEQILQQLGVGARRAQHEAHRHAREGRERPCGEAVALGREGDPGLAKALDHGLHVVVRRHGPVGRHHGGERRAGPRLEGHAHRIRAEGAPHGARHARSGTVLAPREPAHVLHEPTLAELPARQHAGRQDRAVPEPSRRAVDELGLHERLEIDEHRSRAHRDEVVGVHVDGPEHVEQREEASGAPVVGGGLAGLLERGALDVLGEAMIAGVEEREPALQRWPEAPVEPGETAVPGGIERQRARLVDQARAVLEGEPQHGAPPGVPVGEAGLDAAHAPGRRTRQVREPLGGTPEVPEPALRRRDVLVDELPEEAPEER